MEKIKAQAEVGSKQVGLLEIYLMFFLSYVTGGISEEYKIQHGELYS